MPSADPRYFFSVPDALKPYVEFGFVFGDYRSRQRRHVKQLPTGRVTLCFVSGLAAVDGTGARDELRCEGPRSEGASASADFGEVVGVELRAGAARAVLGARARELRNLSIPLETVWGAPGAALAHAMAAAPTARARLEILERELLHRCCRLGCDDRVAVLASQQIERTHGNLQMRELAQRSGYCERALRERFDEWTGVSPKQYARLVRLRRCISLMTLDASPNWAWLADECGFYDQSHMVHEFQGLIGDTPAGFLRDRDAYSPALAPASGLAAVSTIDRRLYQVIGLVSRWVDAPMQTVTELPFSTIRPAHGLATPPHALQR